ncbi:MAG: hypothetical protein R8G01_01940 [Ilumatobacteraceae bacterium]|nr:hypothetical protein [Ilumatobacteraceae bacterium]
MSGMILHLPDGPDGATIGDDSHCGGGLGTEGDSDAFLDLVVEAGGAIESCFIQLEAPETFVNSLVLSFPSEELAVRALTADGFAGVIRYYGLDCCNADPIGTLAEAVGPGAEAIGAASATDTSAVHGWRAGTLVGAVSVLQFDSSSGAAVEAARLAGVQHERMLRPVAVPDGIDEDRLVGLEQATFIPWWVGGAFMPPGFPPMELYRSYTQDGMVDLDYDGARIQVFDLSAVPSGSEPDQMLAVTAELFDSPCTVTEPIEGPGTSLLLGRHIPDEFFSPPADGMRDGWGELTSGECPAGEPNVWMATVEVDDLYIRVNPAFCYNCLSPPTPELPYRSPDGLRTIVAALEPFER